MSIEMLMPLVVALPVLAAILIRLTGNNPNLREAVTLVTAVLLFLLLIPLANEVLAGGEPTLTLAEPFPGLTLQFTLEPLGMLFALIASFLWIVTSIYAIGYMRGHHEENQTRFYLFFALAIAITQGVAFSGNLLTLFVFYEMLTLSTFPLVTHAGTEAARRAGRVYLGILIGTSIAFLLLALIWTWYLAGTLDFTDGGILAGTASPALLGVLLLLFFFGVGKAALMPFHRWLPAAMVAPTPVSALLHAVAVVKAGVFAITKIIIYIFGLDFLVAVPEERLLVYLVGFTIIIASVVALRQNNIKRMLAYSTISQLSYIVLAALVLAPSSEIGAAIHIVAHAFGKITLFFAAGAIYVASKKTEITQLSGIGRRMPWTMTAFAIGGLSMVGVPPTAGFVSKWYMIAGAFENDNFFVLAVLVIATALNAAYFLPIIFRAFFDEENVPPKKDHGEAPWPMVVALTTTAALVLLFFVYNGPVVDLEYGILRGPG
jgi:multicomponent Na+:H+ antiporter subunit D